MRKVTVVTTCSSGICYIWYCSRVTLAQLQLKRCWSERDRNVLSNVSSDSLLIIIDVIIVPCYPSLGTVYMHGCVYLVGVKKFTVACNRINILTNTPPPPSSNPEIYARRTRCRCFASSTVTVVLLVYHLLRKGTYIAFLNLLTEKNEKQVQQF